MENLLGFFFEDMKLDRTSCWDTNIFEINQELANKTSTCKQRGIFVRGKQMRNVPKAKEKRLSSKTDQMKDSVVRDSKCDRNIEKFDDLLFLNVEAFFLVSIEKGEEI